MFPSVVEGEYSLLTDDGRGHTPFEVVGAQVTTVSLAADVNSKFSEMVDRIEHTHDRDIITLKG